MKLFVAGALALATAMGSASAQDNGKKLALEPVRLWCLPHSATTYSKLSLALCCQPNEINPRLVLEGDPGEWHFRCDYAPGAVIGAVEKK